MELTVYITTNGDRAFLYIHQLQVFLPCPHNLLLAAHWTLLVALLLPARRYYSVIKLSLGASYSVAQAQDIIFRKLFAAHQVLYPPIQSWNGPRV